MKTFQDAPAAEAYHRESSLGTLSSQRLRRRIEEWAALDEPRPTRVDEPEVERIELPAPRLAQRLGFFSSLLRARKSRRALGGPPPTAREASLLLWCAAGRLAEDGKSRRTFPSAGGLESTTAYWVSAGSAIPKGTWRYDPAPHALTRVGGSGPADLAPRLLVPGAPAEWPALMILTFTTGPLLKKYGERGYRFGLLECGHAAQNALLAATGLRLGSVPIGGFHDRPVLDAVRAMPGEAAGCVIGLGRPGPEKDEPV